MNFSFIRKTEDITVIGVVLNLTVR